MKAEKIDHVTIVVKDLEGAGKFFADLFGIEFTGPSENPGLDTRELHCPLGIELIAPLTPDGPVARNLERRGEGLTQFALQVPNIEKAVAEMKSKGIRQVGTTGENLAVFHPKDLHGVMITLIERGINQST